MFHDGSALLAQVCEHGRVNSFPAQQRAYGSTACRGIGLGKDLQLVLSREAAEFGSRSWFRVGRIGGRPWRPKEHHSSAAFSCEFSFPPYSLIS